MTRPATVPEGGESLVEKVRGVGPIPPHYHYAGWHGRPCTNQTACGVQMVAVLRDMLGVPSYER